MTTLEWPTWFRWTVRVLALVVMALGAFILYITFPVDSVGKTGIGFIAQLGSGEVQQAWKEYEITKPDGKEAWRPT